MSILPPYSPPVDPSVFAPAYDDVEKDRKADIKLPHLSARSLKLGFIRFCPLEEIAQRWLPHMLRAVAALRMTRNSIAFCLTEESAFIRPPFSRDLFDADPEAAADGMGGSVKGFVNIVSTTDRIVRDVAIELVGTLRVAFSSGRTDEVEVFRRVLSLAEMSGFKEIQLRAGLNCFEFSLIVPKTAPVSVGSQYGRLRYALKAQVPGSGSFLKGKLAVEREMHIVGLPERSEMDELRFNVDEQSNLPWAGQARLEIASDRLTIGEPLSCKLTLASPPSNLTIFGIHVYLAQTVRIVSSDGTTEILASPKRTVFTAGNLKGWATKGFVEDAKRNRSEELLFDGRTTSGQKGECWKWAHEGVLPVDNTLKPTTMYYATNDITPGLKFAHELVFDVYFQQEGEGVEDERLMVGTMYRRDVTVTSAYCKTEALTLPKYKEKADVVPRTPSAL